MLKKLIASMMVGLVLVSSLFCSVPVFASTSFIDVPEDHEYYDSIMWLANANIVSGYSDNTFKPDDFILAKDAINMVVKTFGDPSTLPTEEGWAELSAKRRIWQNNWGFDTSVYRGDFSFGVQFYTAAEMIMRINKITLHRTQAYNFQTYPQIYLDNMVIRGYERPADPIGLITRGELCDMIVWAKDNAHLEPNLESPKIPVDYSYIGTSYSASERKAYENQILHSLKEAPEWLLNYYAKRNGTVKIVEIDSWTFDRYASGIYIHNVANPAIYLRTGNPDAVYHELGHFVWSTTGISLPTEIFNKDLENMKMITFNDHCATSKEEFFAEAFQTYLIKPEIMAEQTPDTYAFVNEICTELEAKYK